MKFPTQSFIFCLFLISSIPAFGQKEFDSNVVCRQKHLIDSLLTLVRKDKDVMGFFVPDRVKNKEGFTNKIKLLKEGLTRSKATTTERTIEIWSKKMLPQYHEEYFFELKKGRLIIVSFGFTASSKIPDWQKVLNFNVTETTTNKLSEYKQSKNNITMPYDSDLEGVTITTVPLEAGTCK
jgi:hypothetical protein